MAPKSVPVHSVERFLTLLFGTNKRFLFRMHAFVNLQAVRCQKRFAAVNYIALEPVFTYIL